MKLLNRYPMLFCLFFVLLATPASANHALYTYGNPNTIQFCEVVTLSEGGPGRLVAVMKCTECGWSYRLLSGAECGG